MLALVLAALIPVLPADQAPPPAGPAHGGHELRPRLADAQPARADKREAGAEAKPFTRLFTLPDVRPPDDRRDRVLVLPAPPSDSRTPREKRRVVCGTTVIIVDGSSDPKFTIVPKGGTDVDPRMPRVPKPMCGEKR